LDSISKLDYPNELFEIILVDDASTDSSIKIIENFKQKNTQFNLKVIPNSRKSLSPKKDAIETAIACSNFDWIYTTDADCVLLENNLTKANDFIQQNNPYFIAGIVQYQCDNSLVEQFQKMDWLSLTGFTLSGFGWKKPMICSGANLVYRKDIFMKLGGFEGNKHVSSGDDVFLLQKFQTHYPEKVHYLFSTDNFIQTKPLKTWKAVFEQHKRWMAKSGSVNNIYVKVIGLIVLATNMSWIILLFGALFYTKFFQYFLLFFTLKLLLDGLFFVYVSHKVKQSISIKYLIISYIIYPFFSVWVSIAGLATDYQWKDRKFSK
jgi:glycosyltransferase involved in cell wall biosynthesis